MAGESHLSCLIPDDLLLQLARSDAVLDILIINTFQPITADFSNSRRKLILLIFSSRHD